MKAQITESNFGFYVELSGETVEETLTIIRLGLNRNATPETWVSAGKEQASLAVSYKKSPAESNYIKAVWKKK